MTSLHRDDGPHLLHVFPAFAGGGGEVRTADLINATAGRFRHSILSISDDLSGLARIAAAGSMHAESTHHASIPGLALKLRALRPDLVLTYGWGGTDVIVAARLAGIRRVVHVEDGFLDDEVHVEVPRRQWARRVTFALSRALAVPSRRLMDLARTSWRLPDRKIRYIPNGVDADRFRPATPDERRASRRSLAFAEQDVVVGIVGALRPEKNQRRLIEAFRTVSAERPDARLVIVGDGPMRLPLETVTREMGLMPRVRFTGSVLDPAPVYRAMDVVALSSDTEQMPLTIVEGMATALPVVSTDVGDVRDMVAEENRGEVVAAGDAPAFAAALSALLGNQDLRRRLGEANRRRAVAAFDRPGMLAAWERLYREFARSQRSSTQTAHNA